MIKDHIIILVKSKHLQCKEADRCQESVSFIDADDDDDVNSGVLNKYIFFVFVFVRARSSLNQKSKCSFLFVRKSLLRISKYAFRFHFQPGKSQILTTMESFISMLIFLNLAVSRQKVSIFLAEIFNIFVAKRLISGIFIAKRRISDIFIDKSRQLNNKGASRAAPRKIRLK